MVSRKVIASLTLKRYRINGSEVKREKGTGAYILSFYNGSLISALQVGFVIQELIDMQTAFPEEKWLPHKFRYPPKNIWKNPETCRQIMEHASLALGIREMEDWYSITRSQVVAVVGRGIISHFKSLAAVLKYTYPQYPWVAGRFVISPKGTWEDDRNVRTFLDYSAKSLSIKELDDWYHFSRDDIDKLGGRELINKHGGLEGALRYAYPDHPWISGRFKYTPRNTWNQSSSVRSFLEFLRKEIGIRSEEDWYRVSAEQISAFGARGLYAKFGTLGKALKFAYPEVEWKLENFSNRDKRTRQGWLVAKVREIFENLEVLENFDHYGLSWGIPSELHFSPVERRELQWN